MSASKTNTLLEAAPTTISFLSGFRQAVESFPNSLAVADDCGELTYAELDALSNRFANAIASTLSQHPASQHLASQHLAQRSIGLCFDKSCNAIAAMIGTLKSGNLFVPFEPECPEERLGFMIHDAQVEMIFCSDQYRQRLLQSHRFDRNHVVAASDAERFSSNFESPEVCDTDLAYVMYTSGSTGNPKGVQIENRALATYCHADIEIYRLTPSDRTLQFSNLTFDIAIEEIFPPLMVGSAVIVRPSERSSAENELSDIVRRYQITALHLATAYFHEWVDLIATTQDRVPASLRMVLATGEKVSPPHYQRWLSHCDHEVLWCNAYGPTETTVTATVFIPPQDWAGESMPIGKPLRGYSAFILDEQDRPLGVGETGHLYIGGNALARGYLNLPERTDAAFRTVELVRDDGMIGNERLYRTGDLARWLESGDIEFAGRVDHQIKLGSYRIEPGEIEYHLNGFDCIHESLVCPRVVSGRTVLVAYCAIVDQDVQSTGLQQLLRQHVPSYMIPSHFFLMESLPKTPNGKIDRKKLEQFEIVTPRPERNTETAFTETEALLKNIWSEILGQPNIDIHDDFFALGGSSLLVTRVIAKIRSKFQKAIPVRDFFANPTIASISRLLDQSSQAQDARQESKAAQQRPSPVVQPDYWEIDGRQLFVVQYKPNLPSGVGDSEASHGVLFCNPDGHEYTRAHRNLQQLALHLSQQGWYTMRFDYSGCGNSSGENAESRVSQWIEEIEYCSRQFRDSCQLESLTLVGLRFGATLLANSDNSAVDDIILWDPVASGTDYLAFLDSLHQRNTKSISNYLVARNPKFGQTFGIELSDGKQEGYKAITVPSDLVSRQSSIHWLFSQGYENSSLCPQVVASNNVLRTSDEILWDAPSLTNAAFSSPEAFRLIEQIATRVKERVYA